MIEEVVPPLAASSLTSPTVVETSINDHEQPAHLTNTRLAPLSDWLPDSMLAELRWVAQQEGRDISDIVVTAVDEFLADHWVRDSDF